MADSMEEKGRTMEVEPAAEGPKVKPKRVLTEAQLEALKLGRSKLAEKRKMMAAEVKQEVGPEEPEIGWASALVPSEDPPKESDPLQMKEESVDNSYQLCSIM